MTRVQLPKNTSTYFPAAGPQFEGTYWKQEFKICDKYSTKWFREDSFFHYPYLLTNAFNNINIPNYRTFQEFPRDNGNHILIGDSGGFQIVSYARKGHTINVEPISILRWEEANCDIGMNLDVPLLDNFGMSLAKSVENFHTFENSRQNYDMLLCNVLHGRNLKEISKWYNTVKNFDFDGWAIGIKPPNNVYLHLLAYLFLHENNAKGLENYCHFFGVASPRNMVVLAMLADKLKMSIGFDASSYNVGSTAREFFMPNNIGSHYYLGSKNSGQRLTGSICDCPVCKNTSIEDIYADTGGSGIIICLHNLYSTIETNRVINNLAGDEKNLHRYVYAMFKKDLKLAVNVNSMLEDYGTFGAEYVYNKYENLFITSGNPKLFCNLAGIE